jgi:hypothetical protein
VICELEDLVTVAIFPLDVEYRITTLCLAQEVGAVEAAHADMYVYLDMNGDKSTCESFRNLSKICSLSEVLMRRNTANNMGYVGRSLCR